MFARPSLSGVRCLRRLPSSWSLPSSLTRSTQQRGFTVHGRPEVHPAGHGHPTPTPQPPAPFQADTPRSKALFRASVAGFFAFTGYVGFTAYDGYYSARARKEAEEAVLAIPLYKGNPVVFLDFAADGSPLGRVVIQLRKDAAPLAAGVCACRRLRVAVCGVRRRARRVRVWQVGVASRA